MAVPFFQWAPAYGAKVDVTPAVRKISFGDGYEQRSHNGINTIREVWEVSFTRDEEEISAITQFLRECAGLSSFDWKTPEGMVKRFVCSDWSISNQGQGVRQLSASFYQVFEA